ncbi:MAG: zinc ABC transporter substrate-binding protein [Clostridia bacterium]|nr:zinc ABC transporter substrate-binding protein [Clostridia bacterium]
MKHIYAKTALLLAAIALFGGVLTWGMRAVRPPAEQREMFTVVASFYPVYIAAVNIAGDVDGVEVVNLVSNRAGCLHDYQMSPADRLTLEAADVLIENGAGAEPFLANVTDDLPTLPVIDLSEGQALLYGPEHHHDHDEDDHDEEEDGHEALEANSHLWVSPTRYAGQVQTLCDGLCAADPTNAEAYRRHAEAYLAEIAQINADLQDAAKALGDTPVVVFHDSLDYLAADLPIHVIATLDIGEESGASAAALAKVEQALSGVDKAIFLYDDQYDAVPYSDLQKIPGQTVTVLADVGVKGNGDAASWCDAQRALIRAFKEAV